VSIGAAIETYTGAKVRVERHPDGGLDHHVGRQGRSCQAGWLFRADGSGHGGQNSLAQRWAEGSFNTDDLLAYSAVLRKRAWIRCLIRGDISVEQMARIFGDVGISRLEMEKKPLSARLQPVAGKKAGEQNTIQQPLSIQHDAARSSLICCPQPADGAAGKNQDGSVVFKARRC